MAGKETEHSLKVTSGIVNFKFREIFEKNFQAIVKEAVVIGKKLRNNDDSCRASLTLES